MYPSRSGCISGKTGAHLIGTRMPEAPYIDDGFDRFIAGAD